MSNVIKVELTAFARIEVINQGKNVETYSSFGCVIPESELANDDIIEKFKEHSFDVFSALSFQLMDIDDNTDVKITLISENEYKINTDEEEDEEEE